MPKRIALCAITSFLVWALTIVNLYSDELDDFLQSAEGQGLDLSAFDDPTVELGNPSAEDFEVVDTFVKKDRESEQERPNEGEQGTGRRIRELWEPKTFSVLVKQRTLLTDLDSNKTFEVKKDFYAKAKEKIAGGEISYILNQKGEARYQTKTSDLIDIEEDLKMLPQLDALEVYRDKNDFNSIDSAFPLEYFFNYHFETVVSDYYPTLFGFSSRKGLAHRFQFRGYYLPSWPPLRFGINLQHVSGTWSDSDTNLFTWSALFLGPNIHAHLQGEKGLSWHFHLGAGQALFHRSQRDLEQHNYDSTTMQFDLEVAKQTLYGKFLAGVGFRKTLSSLKNTTEPLMTPTQTSSVNAFSISLGYSHGWSL